MKQAAQRSTWSEPPPKIELGANQVHLWRALLARERLSQKAAWSILSEDEKQRAQRYKVGRDREHFVARRGILRFLLGKYLNIPAMHVRFSYTSYGKPLLSGEFTNDRLQFNLSHSEGQALYAFTGFSRVGVDLEKIQADPAVLELAQEYFSPDEMKSLDLLPFEERMRAFFQCWTRKEALLKAHGMGLMISPEQIEVNFGSECLGQIPAVYGELEPLKRFRVANIDVGKDFAAALALEGQAHLVYCWQFRGLI